MMSEQQIIAESDRAAKVAARKKRVPYIVWPGDAAKWPPFPFPNIGSHRPKGYKLITHFQCDKLGNGDGFSLGLVEIKQRVKEGLAYAIIEEGEFQLVIGEFEKEG